MRPVRVLVVDDSEDMRLLCRIILDADPAFEVWGEATNGEQAIAAVVRGRPDAIVLDVMMPVMDGLEALPILRDMCPDIPVLILTAAATSEMREQALERGACAVLNKQAALDELTRTLLEICGAGDIVCEELQAS